MYDIIVIGAGPSGLTAAIEASRNLDLLILEEDKQVGIPRHCTGIVSEDAVKLIGYPAQKSIINSIKKAEIISQKEKITISFDKPVTYILNRVYFEELLLDEAIKRGAKIMFNERVKEIKISKDYLTVKTYKNEYKTKSVIYSIGFSKPILENLTKNQTIPAIQYEIEGETDTDSVKIIFSKESKGFFTWYAPTSKNTFLIGLANKIYPPRIMLDKVINKLGIKGKKIAIYSGKIIANNNFNEQVFFDKIVLVGDAANHTKPTTGGGLFYGILGAKIAGKFFSEYLITNEKNLLKKMRKLTKKLIENRLLNMSKFSRFFFSLPLDYYDLILKSIKETGVFNNINSIYQDYHDSIGSLIVSNKKFILNMFKNFLLNTLYENKNIYSFNDF